jgi:hypothetical protein
MELARTAVTDWQNQFDGLILDVAKDSGVPANLLRICLPKASLAAQISAMWGSVSSQTWCRHIAMWNPPFFYQFCPLVMDSGECKKGYLGLDDDQQEYVRLALVNAVNANCEDCPLGIDIERANFSISVFAQTLLANCGQAGQLVKNFTGGAAGKSATYEDSGS